MQHFKQYQWAELTLASARNKNDGKPIANNTRLFERSDGIAVRLHNTDVVTLHPDGTYTLRSGGYETVTTLDRIRNYSPAKLFSEHGDWFLRIEPNADDPAPTVVHRSVMKPFITSDPGPEPVKSELGCQAGSMIGTEHRDEEVRIFRRDMREDDVLVKDSDDDSKYAFITVKRSWTSWVFYGEDAQSYQNSEWNSPGTDRSNTSYKQCPHCAEFDRIHAAWHLRMHGERWGRRFDAPAGFAVYDKMMKQYGSLDAWHDAYLTDLRARRAYIKADREWEQRNRVPFYDGITVDSEGYAPRLRSSGPSPAKLRRHEAAVKKMRARIDSYLDGFIGRLQKGMPMPSGGDCWYCFMHTSVTDSDTQLRVPLGDATDNHEHLIEHMKDRYYVPSLAVNALRERGYKDIGIYLHLDMDQDTNTMGGRDSKYDMVRRDIRKYMVKRLVPAAPTE